MDKITEYVKLFQEYNTHTNLMSKNEIENLLRVHVPDCLSIEKFFAKYNKNIKNLIDIGTGGGLPSVPIALKYPDINVYALDSIEKKIKFIENVKKQLQIENLFPVCSRAEDFEKKSFFDLAVSRAVASLPTLLEYCVPFVKVNGYVVVYKAVTADEELKKSENALKILHLDYLEKILDSDIGETQKCLLVFKKTQEIPLKYPRKNNLPRKNPL